MNRTQSDYRILVNTLKEIEAMNPGSYLTDENIDRNNAEDGGITENDPTYWDAMCANARQAAIDRADDQGIEIKL